MSFSNVSGPVAAVFAAGAAMSELVAIMPVTESTPRRHSRDDFATLNTL